MGGIGRKRTYDKEFKVQKFRVQGLEILGIRCRLAGFYLLGCCPGYLTFSAAI